MVSGDFFVCGRFIRGKEQLPTYYLQQGNRVSGCSSIITVEVVGKYIIHQPLEGSSITFVFPADMKYSFQVSITNAAGRFTTTQINFSNVVSFTITVELLFFSLYTSHI